MVHHVHGASSDRAQPAQASEIGVGAMEDISWIAAVVVATISDWITAARMRRRIRLVFRGDVTELELTSLNLWMKVDEEEKKELGEARFEKAVRKDRL